MNNTIHHWAMKWNVPDQALIELLNMPLPESVNVPGDGSESAIQNDIKLEASKINSNIWRNNNGAGKSEDGRYLRWGLGNDSPKINEAFKSSDLIGITPVKVTPRHVGRKFGVFTAIEVKSFDWKWTNSDRDVAQWKFLQLVENRGGFATFAKSKEDYLSCVNAYD